MPFQKGKATLGAGRKGYEFERQQLERMSAVWNKFLTLLEKAISSRNEIDIKVIKKLQLLGPDMRKILDKLHASKQENKTDHSFKDFPPMKIDNAGNIIFHGETNSVPPNSTSSSPEEGAV